MAMYKAPTFAERTASAAAARQKALEKLKAKPPLDEAVVAARKEAAEAREAAAQAKRDAKKAAEAEKRAALAAKVVAEVRSTAEIEAEKKAERDRRYAQRKARK